MALYIERACSSVADSAQRQAGARVGAPHRAGVAQLPAAAAGRIAGARGCEPRNNQLDFKLMGFPLHQVASRQRAGGLSAIELGPHAALANKHSWRTAVSIRMPEVISGSLLLVGCLIFAMGWLNRAQSFLAYYGALLIGWALVLSRQWVSDMPWPNASSEFLLAILASFVTLAAVQFLLRYGGERRRWVDVGLPAQCAVMPLTLMVMGAQHLHAMATFWYVVLAVEVGAAALLYLRKLWLFRRAQFWPMATLGALMAVGRAGGIRRPAARHRRAHHRRGADHSAAVVHRTGSAHGAAVRPRAAGCAARSRGTRAPRAGGLGADRAQLRATGRHEGRAGHAAERKRIAADLHDDLGAKLLTIVHTSDNERISTLAREALEEMRLSVRGLTGKPVPLLNALGDWRAEFDVAPVAGRGRRLVARAGRRRRAAAAVGTRLSCRPRACCARR